MTTTLPDVKNIKKQWVLIDAKDQVLGRLATRIVLILRGKHRPTFTPFLDTGDGVIVINVEKIALTGNKVNRETLQRYSGYPGGQRTQTVGQVMVKHPDRVLRAAVKGMMPEGPLGRKLLTHLKIYAGSAHPHASQNPQTINPTQKRGNK